MGKSATALQPVLQRVNVPFLSNSNCFWLQTQRAWLASVSAYWRQPQSTSGPNLKSSFLSRHQRLCGFKASPKMTCSPIPTGLRSQAMSVSEMWYNPSLLSIPNFLPFLIHSSHSSDQSDLFKNVNWIVLTSFLKSPPPHCLHFKLTAHCIYDEIQSW